MTDIDTEKQAEIAALAAAEDAARIDEELQGALNHINGNLDAIHQTDDPAERLAIAANTSEWCNYLGTLVESSTALIGAAVEMGAEALKQRDAAMDELSKLVNDVTDMNRENDLVDNLVEAIEENVSEWVFESAYGDAHEEITQQIQQRIQATLEV